jgi:hypothetical protein
VLKITRLGGPTAREAEEEAAEYVEEGVAIYDGRNLGVRTRRDGSGGLRVDFTYDAATPPVAMEITALVEPDVKALGAELLKLEAELKEIVSSEGWGRGCWAFGWVRTCAVSGNLWLTCSAASGAEMAWRSSLRTRRRKI